MDSILSHSLVNTVEQEVLTHIHGFVLQVTLTVELFP